MLPTENETEENFTSKFSTASMGCVRPNRLPTRRRLFAEDEENSPSEFLTRTTRSIYAAEKERALRVWGFDVVKDAPSTSSNSSFHWMTQKASRVPTFYSGGYRTEPYKKPNDRANTTLTDLVLADSIESAIDVEAGSATMDDATSTMADSTSAVIFGKLSAGHVDVTPPKTETEITKKAGKNITTISCQVRLTEFYGQRKRPAGAGSSLVKNKKRSQMETTDLGQGETSTTIFRP